MQQILLLAVVTRFTNIWCKHGFTVCKTAAKFLLPIVLKVFSYKPLITENVSLQIYMDRNNVNSSLKKSFKMLYFESYKSNKNIFIHKIIR